MTTKQIPPDVIAAIIAAGRKAPAPAPGPANPNGPVIARVPAQGVEPLPLLPPAVNDPQAYANADISRAYWMGPNPEVPRQGGWIPVDDTLFVEPTGAPAGGDEDPQYQAHVRVNMPAWNEPSRWSKPFELTFEKCVNTYEQDHFMGQIQAPDLSYAIINSISYDIKAGLMQYELFEFKILESLGLRATIEDMIIDPTSANPSNKYVFSGDTRPIFVFVRIPPDKVANINFKARGMVNLAGQSNHLPGDPITPNALVRVTIQGYFAPVRQEVDGGPNPVDIGPSYDNQGLG